jgi:uncharacterized protein YbaP (TraB family)
MPGKLAVFVALAALAGLVACTVSPDGGDRPAASIRDRLSQETATPPFHRVEPTRGAALLLLGTIHVGPDEGWRLSDEVRDGLRRATALVLEIDLRAVDEDAVGSILAATGLLPPQTELSDVVAPETAQLLEKRDAQLAALGFPYHARKRFKPWFLAIGLIERATAESGYRADRSVEQALLAELGDRPLIGLEGFRDQLAMLDDLPPELQDLMLRDTLERLEASVSELESLMLAWATNDEAALVTATDLGVEQHPELLPLSHILLRDRNRRWLETFRGWLDDPARRGETLFVGVGAGHLVGEDDLIGMLRAAGYVVRPIDQTRAR